jgi:hypothetical protein
VARLWAFADAGASRADLQVFDLDDLEHPHLLAAEVAPGWTNNVAGQVDLRSAAALADQSNEDTRRRTRRINLTIPSAPASPATPTTRQQPSDQQIHCNQHHA